MHQCEPGCDCCGRVAADAEIQVTINPEARVMVQRTDVPVGSFPIDEWRQVRIAIVNEGFVTGPLAMTVEETIPGMEVRPGMTELTGARDQAAEFHVRFTEPMSAELTVRFWALHSMGGLMNKNTVHLLLECPGVEADTVRVHPDDLIDAHIGRGDFGG